MADPVVKFFVCVSGHEYTDKDLDFAEMCTGRVQEQIDTLNRAARAKDGLALVVPPAILRFLRFNFTSGKIEVIEYGLDAGGGKTVSLSETSWKQLSTITDATKYNPKSFVTDRTLRAIKDTDYQIAAHEYPSFKSGTEQNAVMSIADVYESIGSAPNGSVVELSIFAHGYDGGPILVNSDERDGTPIDKRDPFDKDGRWNKDFLPDMGDGSGPASSSRSDFISSFDKNGFVRIWGCNASQAPNKVIYQAYSKRRKKGDAVGKKLAAGDPVANNEKFHFDFSGAGKEERTFREKHYDDDAFFPHDEHGEPDTTVGEFDRTFLEVRQYVARQVRDSYAFQAASGTNILVFGALPGMEGDPEQKGYKLMQVCRKQSPNPRKLDPDKLECPNGYQSRMDFYSTANYIGIKDGDRGYGVFDKAAVDNINKVLGLKQ